MPDDRTLYTCPKCGHKFLRKAASRGLLRCPRPDCRVVIASWALRHPAEQPKEATQAAE